MPVGGGAFSGKDPSKVDRSAAYAARHLAKNIVAHNLADKCQIRVAYAIGKAEPYELSVDTFGSQKEKDSVLNDFVSRFGMKPGVIIERLDLLNVNYREDTLFLILDMRTETGRKSRIFKIILQSFFAEVAQW